VTPEKRFTRLPILMRVLILDGNENQSVAAVRSLARAGHKVCVGSPARWSKAGWSCHCHATFRYPDPGQDARAFVRAILAKVALEPGTLILPMTEQSTLPLSAQRAELFALGGRLVLPPHEMVLRAFDKLQTTRLAQSLGILVPRTIVLGGEVRAADVARELHYPAVLKPRSSEEAHADKSRATGPPRYARNQAEFLAAYADLERRCSAMLVQEFVEGSGVGYFALMGAGEPRAEFTHRRIRDVRPTGSGSAVRVSVIPDARVREAGVAMLRALGWHGVAMVEFRVRPDGTPIFLEINGRFWNSLSLAVYAGADFPALLAELAEHADVTPPKDYRVGIRCRWLLGDFRHLLEVWKGPSAGYPGHFPSRFGTLAAFLTPVRGTYHDNFSLDDPLPELGDWLDFILRRVPGRLR
jgi:predicted ATP-grasp superfamily ATP-dependent carboligase